ncbi:MAG: serine hydrolase domain-containing protein [Vicinamibacterales bacterium]
MRRRTFLSLSPVTALLGAVSARPARARQAAAGGGRFDDIASLVREKMAAYGVPGVGLGIFADGSTTLRGFGVTSLDDPQPVTERTRFTIASISKTMTATAVMRLIDARRVDLRAPLRQYVPEFRVLDDETTRTVSLWHCLTHTPGWEGQLTTEDRGAQALAHFAGTILPTVPQLAPAGRVWSYNNAGFALTGRVIEKVTGKGIHEALRDLVFAPLGLEETTTRLTEAMTHPLTLGHRDGDAGNEVIRPFQTTSSTTAGGVLTSLGDIMRYARFHLGDGRTPEGAPYIARPLVELMRTPQLVKHGTTDQMGVGWHARTVGGVATFAHGGTLNGHCLMLQLVPAQGLAFAIFTNHVGGWRLVQDVEAAILRRYAGVALEPGQRIAHRGVNEAMTFHASALEPQPALDPYLGVYRRPPVGTVEVRREVGRLEVASGPGQPDAPIAFYGPDVAYALSGQYLGMPYEFVRDDAGAVRWIRVNGRIARRA